MKNTVTQEQVEDIYNHSPITTIRMGEKTCVVHAILPCGFEITESSACVDPLNYDEKIGMEICIERIKDKIWELEVYKLQCELYGLEFEVKE